MVLCFEIDRETKDKMDYMVQAGNYRDYSELLEVCVANQHLIHLSRTTEPGGPALHIAPSNPSSKQPVMLAKQASVPVNETSSTTVQMDGIPTIFTAANKDGREISVTNMPDDVFLAGMEVPVDRWIFGQHNKLLPAKANMRALLNLIMAKRHTHGLDLDESATEIASAASDLGNYLRASDAAVGRSRDDAFALAFPSSEAANSDKSRLRYAGQFIGAVSREGRASGLLVDLKLINVDRHKPPRLKLTAAGLDFALLKNPILDNSAPEVTEKFSEDEISFLLGHIRMHVPVEMFAFQTTLESVAHGNATPEKLDLSLKRLLPDRKDRPFTDAFLTTQRAGAISRMADLGLVARARSGPHVTYVVTDRGTDFIKGGR